MRGPRQIRIAALALAAALAACAPPGGDAPDAERPFGIGFEDVERPAVFSLEANAVRDRPDGAAGLWAVVGGLPRPERAELVNLETGDSVVVALFAGRRGTPVRLSNAAAEAIGVGAAPARVRVTALRSRPMLDTTLGRF